MAGHRESPLLNTQSPPKRLTKGHVLWICGAERFLPSEGEPSSGCIRKGGIIKKITCWPLLQGLESGNAGQGVQGEFKKGLSMDLVASLK